MKGTVTDVLNLCSSLTWLLDLQFASHHVAGQMRNFMLALNSQTDSSRISTYVDSTQISLNYEELRLLDYATKSQLYRALEYMANTDSDVTRQAEACFQLSVCNIIAFGTSYNGAASLDWLIQSAKRGYIPAQALVKRMHDALSIELPSTLQESLLSWLKAAVEIGSFVAMQDLKNACHAGTYPMEEFNNSVAKFRTTFGGTGYKLFDDSVMERYALCDTVELDRLLSFEHQKAENNTEARLPALNDRGDTLLHWAAINGNTAVLNTILRSASNMVNVVNNFNETPLLSACRSGQFEAATYLLDHGADAATSTSDGESPLHWLISFTQAGECTEIAQRLEQAGADVNKVAAENASCFNLFSNFLIPGTPLHRATARNHIPAVRALLALQTPADPFVKGGPGAVAIGMERPTPIIWASAAHEPDVLSLFLDRTGSQQLNCGLELHSWRNIGKVLYSMALVKFGGYGIFDTPIMQHRSQLPEFTLLFSAVYADNIFKRMILHGRDHEKAMKKTIDLLIRRGANLGRVDPMGTTALYAAVERGDIGIVRHILSHPTARSALENEPRGRSHMRPLHQAILHGRQDIFDVLHQAGADITAKWGKGSNCLHICGMAKVPDVGIAEKVISLDRAQLYAYDNTETPFCTAVRHHNFDIADLFLRHGAEKDVYVGENRSTTLLGAVLVKDAEALSAARYLLEPRETGEGRADAGEPLRFFRAQFIVCPAGGYSALHAPFLIRLQAPNMPALNYGFEVGSAAPMIRYLLSIFSDPEQLNARDGSGLTPLHYAVMASDADAVEELLKHREWGLETSPLVLLEGQEVTPLDLAEARCAERRTGDGTVLAKRKMIAEAERIRKLLLDIS
jgi:ankyrin repeat protein